MGQKTMLEFSAKRPLLNNEQLPYTKTTKTDEKTYAFFVAQSRSHGDPRENIAYGRKILKVHAID